MRNKLCKILSAGLCLAIAFTLSCSGADGRDGAGCVVKPQSSGSGYDVICGGVNVGRLSDGEGCSIGTDSANPAYYAITCGSTSGQIAKALCGSRAYDHASSLCDLRDGNVYGFVEIDGQVWMSKNLGYNAAGSKCYGNDLANCEEYGRLYDWETAKESCPGGWHLPSKDEWDALSAYIESDKSCAGCDAKHLKSASGWNEDGNGLDSYGFAALPGGASYSDGSFSSAGNYGYWWSTSENNASYAYYRYMFYVNETAIWGNYLKSLLFSVRCLQD